MKCVCGALLPRGRQDSFGRSRDGVALVETLALAEREERELVAVVSDEDDARGERLAVDARMEPVAVTRDGEQAPRARERLAAPAVVLAPVHEPGVDAERDVVQEDAVGDAADVDAPLDAAVESARARRAGRRGRGRGRGRSGCASRTGRRRRRHPSRARPLRRRRATRRRPPCRGSRRPTARRPRPGPRPGPGAVRLDAAAAAASATSSSALGEPSPERGLIDEEGAGSSWRPS